MLQAKCVETVFIKKGPDIRVLRLVQKAPKVNLLAPPSSKLSRSLYLSISVAETMLIIFDFISTSV